MEKLDFALIGRSVMEEMEAAAQEKQILLETDMPEHLMMTEMNHADAPLDNLAENAVSYTPPGGRVKADAPGRETGWWDM